MRDEARTRELLQRSGRCVTLTGPEHSATRMPCRIVSRMRPTPDLGSKDFAHSELPAHSMARYAAPPLTTSRPCRVVGFFGGPTGHRDDQSSSASRFTAGAAGFLILSRSFTRPVRRAEPLRHDASQPTRAPIGTLRDGRLVDRPEPRSVSLPASDFCSRSAIGKTSGSQCQFPLTMAAR
jgi:hypothetical protein